MEKNQNSVVVLRIGLKFWWMTPMGVKYNHTEFELNGGGRERDSQVADPGFKICQKWPESAFFFGIYGCLSGAWRGVLAGKLIYT